MNIKLIEDVKGYSLNISEKSDWQLFNKVADEIINRFNGKIVERLDGLEQRYWDIEIDGKVLTMHLEHYCGISLFAKNDLANELIAVISNYLKQISRIDDLH